MGHKNKRSLLQQMTDTYQDKLRIGESKLAHKIAGDATDYIFSWSTYKAYTKHARYFLTWAKSKYKCKTLAQARQFADEWLQLRIDEGKSAYTIKLELAALCKLYGDTAADYIPTPPRLRKNIVRSRRQAVRDAHFSEANHADFCEFARSTGLRRAELKALTGDKVLQENGEWYIIVNKMSKGGRPRKAPIVGNVSKIVGMMQAAGTGKVFPKVPNGADIHSYRAEYATQVYLNHARPLELIPREDRYYRRKEMRGRPPLDRRAMGYASVALGHSKGRVSVVGEHYIRL